MSTPTATSVVETIGANASEPSIDSGEVVVPATRSPTDHATTPAPTSNATPCVSRSDDATSALPQAAAAASTPNAPPARIQATVTLPSAENRGPASAPAIAPVTAPMVTTPRTWRSAADRNTIPRSTGASSTCWTSGASNASGPPWDPDRSPIATSSATTAPIAAGPRTAMSWTVEAASRRSPTTAASSASTANRPIPTT